MAKEIKEEQLDSQEEVVATIPASYDPVKIDLTEGSDRYPDVYFDLIPDHIVNHQQEGQHFLFYCENQITLRVSVYSDHIWRFRYSLTGEFQKDFSYALADHFQEEKVVLEFSEQEKQFTIAGEAVKCVIQKSGMQVNLFTPDGIPICQEEKGFQGRKTILKGITELGIHKKAPLEERYFGLGDKSRGTDLRGNKLQNWCTDAFAYNDTSDELYRAIPFYYGLQNGIAYGIFMDNSYRSHFDFDSKKEGSLSFVAAGGEMNYYFIYGPELGKVAERYTDITGRPDLPPLWALGFHQCRWSYYPEQRVRDVAKKFRDLRIPCDAIYLDIDYMDGYRCFTWNKDHFPDPKQMIADLKEDGFKTIVMIDPGIKADPDYPVYKEGKEKDVFCKRPDGELMVGPVWPSDCVFPDFTLPETREWWGPLYKELYVDQGVSGFWNDMNEPAVFKIDAKTFPEDIRHDHDGQPCSHAKAHNIYGLQMSRATQEGLLELQEQKRPFVLTRATFSGGQRYASAWTGDNVASWDHLRLANIQCQRMSISGFSFIGTDIGGFVDQPTPELMIRWLQLGIFHPVYRVHSMGNNADGATEVDETQVKKSEAEIRMDQEPWSFGKECEDLGRQAIEWRYRLLPYLYTAFWQYATKGTPMLKNLAFVDQTNPEAIKRENEFLFGDHLLVSPVLEKGIQEQPVYLPKGNWYNYKTGEAFAGRQEITVATPLDTIPVFVRAGAVVPHYPVMQYTQEKPVEVLELYIYYNTVEVESCLYEDNGDGFEHQQGEFSLRKYTTHGSISSFSVRASKEGNHVNSYSACKIHIFGLPFKPVKCHSQDGSIGISVVDQGKVPVYVLTLTPEFSEFELISG